MRRSAKHGLFFPPELSTSNRATIGGMINTDACGQGSCLYGKTRDHVLELTSVLLDGTVWQSGPLDAEELAAIQRRPDRVGAIHRLVDAIQREQAALIASHFPKLNRCLTGYDLAHIRDERGRFNLNSILCGAEGTLGFVAEAKLNVLPIPKYSALVNVRYGSFDAALRDAQALTAFGAASIETVDSKVLALAQNDIIWEDVRDFFPDDDGAAGDRRQPRRVRRRQRGGGRGGPGPTDGRARRPKERARAVAASPSRAASGTWSASGRCARNPSGCSATCRATSGRSPSSRTRRFRRRTSPTTSPSSARALDARGLVYGMFGHVDAGVLHVRPAIDMKDPAQEQLIREVTEEVVGAHAEVPRPALGRARQGRALGVLARLLRPALPDAAGDQGRVRPPQPAQPRQDRRAGGGELLTIDGVPTRGQLDRTIPSDGRARTTTRRCTATATAPATTGTRTTRCARPGRGRASGGIRRRAAPQLMREWLRQLAGAGLRSGCRRAGGCAARGLAHAARPHPQHARQAPGRGRLLARGQGGDGRLPRVQVLRRPVPDQGRRA